MRALAVALALIVAAACAERAGTSREDWMQTAAEAEARAASLERMVERLERELAEAQAALAQAKTPAADPRASAQSPAVRSCAATTASGAPCKRPARAGERYCWQHSPELRAPDAPADPAASQ